MDKFLALAGDVGERVDKFVSKRYPNFTRSALSKLFYLDMIKIDGKSTKSSHKLREGDHVSVDSSLLNFIPDQITIPVLYEDNDVIVIDKPAGLLTHSKGSLNLEPTVASFINGKITDRSLSGDRAGIVHRLDRATSGVIICAKNATALKYLQKQFAGRYTQKTYMAVVRGVPTPKSGVIDAAIARNPKKPKTFMVSSRGKTATTAYKVINSYNLDGKPVALVELQPVTGRTHQLRVHLTSIGHPIVGDSYYSKSDNPDQRLMLHAWKLALKLPSGIKKSFTATLPSEFSQS